MAYGAVDRQTWNDEKFRSWDRDTRDVWLYLLTCPHGNRIGCFVLDPLYVASDVQIKVERAKECLQTLDEADRIVWDTVARTVCIKRHLHPDYNPLANESVAKAAAKNIKSLPDSPRALKALHEAVERWWRPHYTPMKEALEDRGAHRADTVPAGSSAPSSRVDQDQDQDQDHEQDQEEQIAPPVEPDGADLPADVVPLYEELPPSVQPLAALGTEPLPEEDRGPLTGALVAAWVSVQRLTPSEKEKRKQGAVAKRLAADFSPFRLAVALLGLNSLWEHDEAGNPWDLFDLERKLSKAVERGVEVLEDGPTPADRKVSRKEREIEQAMEAVG